MFTESIQKRPLPLKKFTAKESSGPLHEKNMFQLLSRLPGSCSAN